MTKTVDASAVRQFREQGYCLIEGVIDADTLAMLREESELAVAWQENEIRSSARDVEMLNRLDHRYFIPRRSSERSRLRELILSNDMADVVRPLLWPDAYLFIDVFIHKNAESESDFAWHQDHGYVAHYGFGSAQPSVTVWTPLDDVTDENGALHVLPFSRVDGGPRLVEHTLDPATNDCVATVADPGECIAMTAGSLLVMSGLLLHRSGPNTSGAARRAYQWQYSPAPVLHDGKPISLATPFLAAGSWVDSRGATPTPDR